jgi:hypothetical protein
MEKNIQVLDHRQVVARVTAAQSTLLSKIFGKMLRKSQRIKTIVTISIIIKCIIMYNFFVSLIVSKCNLLQTSKTDNNALDIDAIYNLKLRKT